MKYNEVKDMIESANWTLLSSTYQNMKTPLSLICPNGHSITLTLKEWRKKYYCPICAQEGFTDSNTVSIIPKDENTFRIIAFDQATQISGWAVFDNSKYAKSGIFKAHSKTTADRINEVRNWFIRMCEVWKPDMIIFEDIFYQETPSETSSQKFKRVNGNFYEVNSYSHNKSLFEVAKVNVQTYKILAELLGVLENTSLVTHQSYEIIKPTEWRSLCGLKAKMRADQKREAQNWVKSKYDIDVSQDEADAVCIGSAATQRYGHGKKEIISWT